MQIAPELLEQVVEHARRDAPDECCGVVITRGGVAERVIPLENVLTGSPKSMGFEVDGMALHRLLTEAEDDGAELGAIYHSHPRSPAVPSATDENFAGGWPDVEWIIVGNVTRGQLEVRSWLIDGTSAPVEVELTS